MTRNGISYRDAGVDIDAGNALVERIKPAAAATVRPGVMDALGGFGALFDPRAAGYDDPVLVAATDGVGTKLRIAIDTGAYRSGRLTALVIDGPDRRYLTASMPAEDHWSVSEQVGSIDSTGTDD